MAADEITFTHAGEIYTLTRSRVLRSVSGVSPEPIRTHWVDIGGVRYPVKQVFARATKLDRLDFATNQARNRLKQLGFVVGRTKGQTLDWDELIGRKSTGQT